MDSILVIDDSVLIGKFVEQAFEGENIRVYTVQDAEKGLELGRSLQPTLLLLDVVMPRLSGFETCRRWRACPETAGIPVIFITAHGDAESVAKGFELGAADYIAKPFHLLELRVRILAHLKNIRTERALLRANEELQAALRENRRLLQTDGLTGIYNRRYISQTLHELSVALKKAGEPLSIVFGDIDDFKYKNDTHGHLAGDYVLQTTAGLIARACGRAGIVARWGGEEFLVLLPGFDGAAAYRMAERLRETVAEYQYCYGKDSLACTITFGVIEYDFSRSEAENMSQVDAALYRGKREGKNRCILSGIDEPLAEERR